MQRQDLQKKCEVLVSGMGPAGLAVAYEAAKQGKKVIIIEKRDGQFTRSQRVFIGQFERRYLVAMMLGENHDRTKFPDADAYAALRSLSKDERKKLFKVLRNPQHTQDDVDSVLDELTSITRTTFFELMALYDSHACPQDIIRNYQDAKFINEALNPFDTQNAVAQIPIRHIERYLLNRIQDLNKKAGRVVVDILTNSSIVDLEENKRMTAQVETKESNGAVSVTSIDFNTLIGADGSKHESANLVNSKLHPVNRIKFERVKKSNFKKSDHFYVHLKLQTRNGNLDLTTDYSILSVTPPAEQFETYLNFVSFDRNAFNSSGRKSVKCVLTSEMPASLIPSSGNALEADDILAYVKSVLLKCKAIAGLDENNMEIEIVKNSRKNYRSQMAMFTTAEATKANKMYVQLKPNQLFVLMGDANCHPDYQHSHGMGDALNQAKWLGNVFAGEFSLERYADLSRSRTDAIQSYYRRIHEGTPRFPKNLTQETDTHLYAMRRNY